MWANGRLWLGYWPHAYHPDPKEFPCTAIIHVLIYVWIWLAPVAMLLPGVRLFAAIHRRSGAILARMREWAATLMLMAMAFWILSADRTGS